MSKRERSPDAGADRPSVRTRWFGNDIYSFISIFIFILSFFHVLWVRCVETRGWRKRCGDYECQSAAGGLGAAGWWIDN
jgi:hypothetical protein